MVRHANDIGQKRAESRPGPVNVSRDKIGAQQKHRQTGEQGDDKGHDLVLAQGGDEQAHVQKKGTEQDRAHIGADDRPQIRIAQDEQHQRNGEGGCQRHHKKHQTG